ncbi:hypothetical protein [Rubripirellula lacrimiformis]|uniref:hypothetical protein n=1 Tax=Rubripirellula lacrimiformis TaxID=1930273 RepID=UPI001C54E10F|nr:hypothetical protein [Rubripirellula lacrimiformis]
MTGKPIVAVGSVDDGSRVDDRTMPSENACDHWWDATDLPFVFSLTANACSSSSFPAVLLELASSQEWKLDRASGTASTDWNPNHPDGSLGFPKK